MEQREALVVRMRAHVLVIRHPRAIVQQVM